MSSLSKKLIAATAIPIYAKINYAKTIQFINNGYYYTISVISNLLLNKSCFFKDLRRVLQNTKSTWKNLRN